MVKIDSEATQIELGSLGKAWHLNGNANLGMHVAVLGRLMDRFIARRLAGHDLNLAQWRSIALLHILGPATFVQIAELSWLDRADLSRALVKLQEKTLVANKPNPADGRSQIFSLTQDGKRIYAAFAADWREAEQEFFALFQDGELEQFNKTLEKMAGTCVKLLGEL